LLLWTNERCVCSGGRTIVPELPFKCCDVEPPETEIIASVPRRQCDDKSLISWELEDNSPAAMHSVWSNTTTVQCFLKTSHHCNTIAIVSRCLRPNGNKIACLNFLLHGNFPCRTADSDRATICVRMHTKSLSTPA